MLTDEEERRRLKTVLKEVRQERADKQREVNGLLLKVGSAGRELARLETLATERRVEHAGRAEKCDRLRTAWERATAAARPLKDRRRPTPRRDRHRRPCGRCF